MPRLHAVAEHGTVEELRALFEEGVEASQRRFGGETALSVAAGAGRSDMVEALLEAWPAGVNAGDVEENRPLHTAARHGRVGVIALLARRGAILALRNDVGATAVGLAAGQGHVDAVAELVRLGYRARVDDLARAAAGGQAEACRFLVERCGVSPQPPPPPPAHEFARSTPPPLLLAARAGSCDTYAELLRCGADPLSRFAFGGPPRSALQLAAQQGHAGMVLHILATGAYADAAEKAHVAWSLAAAGSEARKVIEEWHAGQHARQAERRAVVAALVPRPGLPLLLIPEVAEICGEFLHAARKGGRSQLVPPSPAPSAAAADTALPAPPVPPVPPPQLPTPAQIGAAGAAGTALAQASEPRKRPRFTVQPERFLRRRLVQRFPPSAPFAPSPSSSPSLAVPAAVAARPVPSPPRSCSIPGLSASLPAVIAASFARARMRMIVPLDAGGLDVADDEGKDEHAHNASVQAGSSSSSSCPSSAASDWRPLEFEQRSGSLSLEDSFREELRCSTANAAELHRRASAYAERCARGNPSAAARIRSSFVETVRENLRQRPSAPEL